MSDIAIRVEGLSKRYKIGQRERYYTLRDSISHLLVAPFRGIKNVSKFEIRNSNCSQNPDYIWALRDVSFEVKHGEVIGIIGRNGAGKSTLLKILSRITKPTEGRAVVNGRVGSLLEVGTGFHPELTGRENIYLNGAILGMKKAEIDRKFDEIVAFSEVEQFIDTPVKHYSSGMYVRLAFAVAAYLEPEILLVDEVLAVGDAAFQKKCLGKMGDVAKEGRTVLFVSHNMPTVEALCGRALLLVRGEVVAGGSPSVVIRQYLSGDLRCAPSKVDLSSHPGRCRSEETALLAAWTVSADGRRSNVIRTGEGMAVYFQFECARSVRNPGFGLGIDDGYGHRVFSINNYMSSSEKNTFTSLRSGIVRFLIPSLPLVPSTYSVTLSLVQDQREWIDCVEGALAIVVEPADVYGSGKMPERCQGVVCLPAQIDVQWGDRTPGLPVIRP